jgi:hypothetical protein
MVVGLTTTDAISVYHHNVVNSNPADDEVYSIDTTLCDNAVEWKVIPHSNGLAWI